MRHISEVKVGVLGQTKGMSPPEQITWARAKAEELEIPKSDKPPCATCSGDGWIGTEDFPEWCPDCGGTGYQQPDVCPRCGGLKYVCRDLPTTHTDFGRAMSCPDCLSQLPVGDLMARCFVPQAYRGWTLDTFEEHCGGFGGIGPGQTDAYLAAVALAESSRGFRQQHNRPGLFLYGPRGVGKTGIAIGVLAALARYVSCRFVSFPRLLHDIRQTFDADAPTSQSQILDGLSRHELLVIDELRSRESLPWHGEVAWELLDVRYQGALDGKITIVTAKGGPADVEREFGVARGAEIASRLEGCCHMIGMAGADLRREAA